MKFGKFIQGVAAEWATPHYINYKALKKIIGSVDDDPPFAALHAQPPAQLSSATGATTATATATASGSTESSPQLLSLKTAFFFKLERELEKVNAFYIQKEAEFKIRLRSLLDKKRILSSSPTKAARSSRSSLHQAFLQFQNDLAKLQKFVEVNATGFRKILKKFDKRAKSATKELYLSRQIEIQPCFNNEVLTELTDIAAANISELEKQIETMELDEQENSSAAAAIQRRVNGNSTLDEAESELSKYLSEKDHVHIGEFLQRQQPAALAAEDPQFFSRLFLRFSAESSAASLAALLATGLVSINSVDDANDRSCLHEAAIAGRIDVLRLALAHGASPDALDVYGRRPLHYAAMYGQTECTAHLLTLAHSQTQHPSPPVAASADLVVAASVSADANAGTNATANSHVTITQNLSNVVDHDGNTPLVYAIAGGHTACVEILLRANAAIEPLNATAPIPLSLACKYGHADIVTLLLRAGARIIQDPDGLDALHVACREGHATVAQLLIAHGANIEARDSFNGWTPVFFSASEGHFECIQTLLAAGCRIDIKDDSNWLPWTYALYRGHIKVANLLHVADQNIVLTMPSVSASAATTSAATKEPEAAQSATIRPMAPSSLFLDDAPMSSALDDNTMPDINLDDIPSLSLPPPIIPFRIYGHNYLEKKMYLQIHFGSFSANIQESPIRLFNLRQLSSLKLVISSRPDDAVPHSVILPLKDELEIFTFMIDPMEDYSIQFDIFPTFGSKVMGRAVVLRSQFNQAIQKSWNGAGESESMICPLFDNRLHIIGEIAFGFSIVMPFEHAGLRIGGKVETYWKSTKVVVTHPKPISMASTTSSWAAGGSAVMSSINANAGHSHESVHSFITASSLAQEYIQLVVQLTKDGIPVVYPDWFVTVGNLQISLAHLTYAQVKAILSAAKASSTTHGGAASNVDPILQLNSAFLFASGQKHTSADIARAVYDSFLTLDQVLTTLPLSIGVHISLKYPTTFQRHTLSLSDLTDINGYVDTILRTVYNTANQRSIIFSSFNPSVCTAINWKQPNYGVFFGSHCGFSGPEEAAGEDRRCTSIKEAIKFAKSSNFLGLICQATPLVQMPVLINTVKESGLILATFGPPNNDPFYIRQQETFGVDALIIGRVFRYNT
eukprot:jgi/Hompol1/3960/HPOL_003414-RA